MTSSAPTSAACSSFSSSAQARSGISAGTYEILVPSQDNRVYFADTPEQVLALLDELIGLVPWKRREHLQQLATVPEGGIEQHPVLWVGDRGSAYLAATATGSGRKCPRFRVGDRVCFYLEAQSYTVTGISLKYHVGEHRTSWQYHYAEGTRLGWGVEESLTRCGRAGAEPTGPTLCYRAVRAEAASDAHYGPSDLSQFNTRDAGPWQGLGREEFRAAVAVTTSYAFVIRPVLV